MPRTENDTRSPYAKATSRRITQGLDLVAKLRAELDHIERALTSGQFVYHSSLAEQATRLGATMAELEALDEMHDDEKAVAALQATDEPALNALTLSEAEKNCLSHLNLANGIYDPATANWYWDTKPRTKRIFAGLAAQGLVKITVAENSNRWVASMTPAGQAVADSL